MTSRDDNLQNSLRTLAGVKTTSGKAWVDRMILELWRTGAQALRNSGDSVGQWNGGPTEKQSFEAWKSELPEAVAAAIQTWAIQKAHWAWKNFAHPRSVRERDAAANELKRIVWPNAQDELWRLYCDEQRRGDGGAMLAGDLAAEPPDRAGEDPGEDSTRWRALCGALGLDHYAKSVTERIMEVRNWARGHATDTGNIATSAWVFGHMTSVARRLRAAGRALSLAAQRWKDDDLKVIAYLCNRWRRIAFTTTPQRSAQEALIEVLKRAGTADPVSALDRAHDQAFEEWVKDVADLRRRWEHYDRKLARKSRRPKPTAEDPPNDRQHLEEAARRVIRQMAEAYLHLITGRGSGAAGRGRSTAAMRDFPLTGTVLQKLMPCVSLDAWYKTVSRLRADVKMGRFDRFIERPREESPCTDDELDQIGGVP